ncbi:Calcium and calcium/calmodulin-dependent serine/threonine-protein kinase [Rhynchospora pubera]|uniref:Calcium and calcium/calmodulin-dependent serine/threonine-protein kinase n=1 Tax=Rhynchospora pubera TaxID=906938 RepID=A0AAV8GXU7_9POAL|nr:Calcium and calcium/calmodulin-dependent serine/threonine-protein kinase [Rhynchospora pubera]
MLIYLFSDSGGSPGRVSLGSGRKQSSASSSRSRLPGSSSHACKDFLSKFVDSEILTLTLEDWLSGRSGESGVQQPVLDVPFDLAELKKFDYALEGVAFQQLVRMPNALYASTGAVQAIAHLAIEDFLHAAVKGLWERFWGHESALPFTVQCIHSTSARFYPAEEALARDKLDGVCATAILFKGSRGSGGYSSSRGKWDQILELALLRPDIGSLSARQNDGQRPSHSVLGEALFFALRVMLSRSLSKSRTAAHNSNCMFVLLVDSQYGGVVKVEGDVRTLEFDSSNVYDCAADWIKMNAKITVSPVDRVWNKLGNANWGDVGTLQILLAIYHSIILFCGPPKYALEDLATEHSSRIQSRRSERALTDCSEVGDSTSMVNGNRLFRSQNRGCSPEIVEVQEETVDVRPPEETLKLDIGSVVAMEDADFRKEYEINDFLSDSDPPIYHSNPVDEPSRGYLLYVGSSPSHLEPAWEDMNSWYQVQRQTKVLTLMKQRGLSSKHIPQIVASGRLMHPGECNKPSNGVSCGHPWCGTPILVTSPVGETVSNLIRNGLFGAEDALKCCHDCLTAISAASSVGIRHGDIRPENVIRVTSGSRNPYFVLIGWGHAILEDRDRPSMNLFYSSTFALQEGKLCAASDAESLIYLLYFACGGVSIELDSVEGALQWRESSWSKRIIQQRLGDVSAVLKAFADYVDSLCGTPYPINYDIWLRRLRRVINEDHGKEIDTSG